MRSKQILFVLTFLLLLTGLSHAWVQSTTEQGGKKHWSQKRATLNLRVGCPPNRPLTAWGPCWDDAAEDAATQWNATGAQFTFRIQSPSQPAAVSCTSDDVDGINTVVWSDTYCDMAFGDGVLATTRRWFRSTGELVDSDVHFNTNKDWTTYSGPRRSGATDFHRVAIHEFGHVLGLDHPDDHGQRVTAIMNAGISNIDRLQADDIAGIRAIYSRASTGTPKGSLGNPGHGTFKSGIGVISGWVCHAQKVEVLIGTQRVGVVYGTERADTRSVCGDTNNGFVTLVNWNLLGDGVHTARLVVDGVAVGTPAEFKVTTFGQEFYRGAEGAYSLPNFPSAGIDTVVVWDERVQNFVIGRVE